MASVGFSLPLHSPIPDRIALAERAK